MSAVNNWLTSGWDWIDKRQIDTHILSLCILYGTVKLVEWSVIFAATSARPGMEVAAIIAAVTTPYAALQGAAIKFHFEARK